VSSQNRLGKQCIEHPACLMCQTFVLDLFYNLAPGLSTAMDLFMLDFCSCWTFVHVGLTRHLLCPTCKCCVQPARRALTIILLYLAVVQPPLIYQCACLLLVGVQWPMCLSLTFIEVFSAPIAPIWLTGGYSMHLSLTLICGYSVRLSLTPIEVFSAP
jgi:hypothetical protein